MHFIPTADCRICAFYVSCFCRCLWKCPVENFPTASFPFSPSLKCPQNFRLLAYAAAEPHLGPPAPEKPHRLPSAPAFPATNHQRVECTCTEAFQPAGSCGLQGTSSGEGHSRGKNIQINSPRLDFLCTMPLLDFQLHEIKTDDFCSDCVAACTPTNAVSYTVFECV